MDGTINNELQHFGGKSTLQQCQKIVSFSCKAIDVIRNPFSETFPEVSNLDGNMAV
ncbi:hypothetical protein FWK35_00012826 [Aphis craccivora]|uniref:Uncharacterized protein n=1 Tax=Aphis craccivora TaxID=307492 RepID=A0A6G0ZQ46_APHCR|nr:hypothetical protein FWK35_00012826 [Aphis craccivora]